MRFLFRTAVAAVLACVALTATIPAGAAGDPNGERSVSLHQAVGHLTVAPEGRTGYDRLKEFGGWVDADKDGCNTRKEVLIDEAVAAPAIGAKCVLSGGSWFSWYDDVTVNDASALDIDHLVPLAEAWDSGASKWTKARRVAYANYLADPRHLFAVTGRSNRSKADQDPATWMPPSSAATCRYTADWLSVKLTWNLSIDSAEHEALARLADGCADQDIVYAPAP